MKKKFLIIPLLMFGLASCGNQPTTPLDYMALYGASIKANMQFVRDYLPQKQAFEGDVKSSLNLETMIADNYEGDVPASMQVSSEFTSGYQVATDYPKTEIVFNKPSLKVKASEGEDSLDFMLNADNLSIIQSMFGQYLKYSNFASTFDAKGAYEEQVPQQEWDSITKRIVEYSDKWIDLTALGMPSKQVEALKKLRSITMADVEKFLVENPLLINIGSATNDGTKYTFDVQLNNDKLVDVATMFAKTMIDEEPTDEEKAELKANLEKVLITGKITFDSKDPLYIKITNLTISHKDNPSMTIVIDSIREKEKANLVAKLQKGEKYFGILDLNETIKDKNIDFNLTVALIGNSKKQDEKIEILALSGKVDNGVIQELKGNFGLPQMPVSAEIAYKKGEKFTLTGSFMGQKMLDVVHTMNDKGFEGSVELQGSKLANWKGTLKDKILQSLELQVKNFMNPASDKNLVSIKLDPKDDMASGQFAVVMDDTILASGQMSVQAVENEKFSIALKDVSGAFIQMKGVPMLIKNFDVFVTLKKIDAKDKTISIPTETVQVQ